jgi:hypothetical protein
MKKNYFILLNILSIYVFPALAQDKIDSDSAWNQQNLKIVTEFISDIKDQNMENLCNRISFPFERKYPLPDIKSKEEFLRRYHEVFDDSLIKMITHSNPESDWGDVGWRGIIFLHGELWLGYEEGGLISVNYQSKFEIKRRAELIESEKRDLYPAIRGFKEPIILLETDKYRIRIDDLGKWNYRYASWPIKDSMREKPEMVLEKGKLTFEGSGGDHYFEFRNGDYLYECSINIMGPDDISPATLTIKKGSRVILSQNAKIIRK